MGCFVYLNVYIRGQLAGITEALKLNMLRTLERAGTSNVGTPSLPRLPNPAVDPQVAASAPYSSFSELFGIALEELLDAKRVANVFIVVKETKSNARRGLIISDCHSA